MKWLLLAALALAGCTDGGALSFPPAGSPGPASLQLVPADYYSGTPAPRANRATDKPKPKPEEPPPVEAHPEPPTLPEAVQELEKINDRLQELRRRLNKPRQPVEPPL